MKPIFDHIALGAATLDQGVAWMREKFGIEMEVGGEHPRMSTHNRLTRTGSDNFFEVISINPAAPAPAETRWYRMDDPAIRAAVAREPKLLSWIVAVPDIDAALETARSLGLDLGEGIEVSRGDLVWRLSVRPDGDLPEGGTLPVFIQWPEGPHPCMRMPDLGLRIEEIRLAHPDPAWLGKTLDALGVAGMVTISEGAAGLSAELSGPDGRRQILA